VSKGIAELSGRLLLAVGDFATVDRGVVVLTDSIDANGAEGEFVEPHIWSVIYEGALRVRLRASRLSC
jgi:hypothetical protein